jgi:hypothetical protein
VGGLEKGRGFKFVIQSNKMLIYSDLAADDLAGASPSVFLGNKMDWMFGKTPP